jgi:hypothetical protein
MRTRACTKRNNKRCPVLFTRSPCFNVFSKERKIQDAVVKFYAAKLQTQVVMTLILFKHKNKILFRIAKVQGRALKVRGAASVGQCVFCQSHGLAVWHLVTRSVRRDIAICLL